MKRDRQRAPLRGTLLLLLILWARTTILVRAQEIDERGEKKFGDKCAENNECGFEGSICTGGHCLCLPELPVTNHLDKCGIAAKVNESCFFHEQCEATNTLTECKDSVCACRFGRIPLFKSDGQIECMPVANSTPQQTYRMDSAMIGILVAMFLMFVTLCIVLRLFSKARWRENRTIFNTPNPRLMNASLLKDNKYLHERRGSRTSRGPSRQPSMASLRPHSPNSQGSRRGSRGSSNASATSIRSNKSPPQAPNLNSATTPMLESVTVEVQQSKS